jgi:hypothetical protein
MKVRANPNQLRQNFSRWQPVGRANRRPDSVLNVVAALNQHRRSAALEDEPRKVVESAPAT